MRYKKRIAVYAAVILAVLLPLSAHAQATSPGIVQERCDLVKSILDQQRKRDLVARINLGRAYQNIINQQEALTSRIRNNKLAVAQFESQGRTVQAEIESFRSSAGSYAEYDDALGTLLSIDCQTKPAEFVAQLEHTRLLRFAAGQQVGRIDTALARYREIVVNLGLEIERLTNAVLGERQ